MLAGTVGAARRSPSGSAAAVGATAGPTVLLVVALVSVGILPQALQRPDSAHLTWVTCVSWPFAVVAVVEVVQRAGGRRDRCAGPSAAGAAVAARADVHVHGAVHVPLLPAAHPGRARPGAARRSRSARRPQLLLRRPPRPTSPVAGSSTTSTGWPEPGDRLLVGPSDLRRTWYSDAFFYWLFPELEPATYFIEMDPGLANADGSRPRRRRRLRRLGRPHRRSGTAGWSPTRRWTSARTPPTRSSPTTSASTAHYEDGLVRLYYRCR